MITSTRFNMAAPTYAYSQKPITKFDLGQVIATPRAIRAIKRRGQQPTEYLLRHQIGDWGDVSPEIARSNELSVQNNDRIISTYLLDSEEQVLVITNADRETTCILVVARKVKIALDEK